MGKQMVLENNIEDYAVEWPAQLLPYIKNDELYKMLDAAEKGEFVTYEESIRRNAP